MLIHQTVFRLNCVSFLGFSYLLFQSIRQIHKLWNKGHCDLLSVQDKNKIGSPWIIIRSFLVYSSTNHQYIGQNHWTIKIIAWFIMHKCLHKICPRCSLWSKFEHSTPLVTKELNQTNIFYVQWAVKYAMSQYASLLSVHLSEMYLWSHVEDSI